MGVASLQICSAGRLPKSSEIASLVQKLEAKALGGALNSEGQPRSQDGCPASAPQRSRVEWKLAWPPHTFGSNF